MSKVIMGIGIPGSGKTTALKPFAEKNSYTYISPDEIRGELSQDAGDQSRNREVWEETYKRVGNALSRGETGVVDATFVNESERKEFIAFAREQGADKVQGVFAAVPFETARERNNNRDRVVPEHALERMQNMLEKTPPTVDDGFDSVFDIDEIQELIRVERRGENGILTREFKNLH
jgi:predicted kinase